MCVRVDVCSLNSLRCLLENVDCKYVTENLSSSINYVRVSYKLKVHGEK